MLSFYFEFNIDDFIQSYRAIYFNQWRVWAGLLAVAFVQALFQFYWPGRGAWLPLLAFLLPALGLLIAFEFSPFLFARHWRKENGVRGVTQVTVANAEIYLRDELAETRLAWGDIRGVIETQTLYVLLLGEHKTTFRYIPKRALAVDKDHQAFRDMLDRSLYADAPKKRQFATRAARWYVGVIAAIVGLSLALAGLGYVSVVGG